MMNRTWAFALALALTGAPISSMATTFRWKHSKSGEVRTFRGSASAERSALSRDSWVGQRNGHAFAVKVADGGVNGVVEFDDVSEGLVGQLIRL